VQHEQPINLILESLKRRLMKFIKISATLLLTVGFLGSCQSNKTEIEKEAFGWTNATDSLTIIGEGTISREGENVYGTAYTPGGDTLFFHTTNRADGESGIAMTTRTDTGWTTPKPAPFETERYAEGAPSITPDGEFIVFNSDRPSVSADQEEPQEADDFYRSSRSSGWTNVTRMTNTPVISEKRASVASDGTIYYWTYVRGEGMGFYIGRVAPGGAIQDTVNADSLLFENDGGENNPYIDPQKRFILFAMYGREDGYGEEDLYIATRQDSIWSTPVNLGPAVNSAGSDTHPFITPDGSKLFLTSTRLRSESDTDDNWNHYVIKTDAVPLLKDALER
jgi:hypothetical protein